MAIKFTKNTSVSVPNSFFKRIKTGILPIDNLFGGGLVAGQVLTVCGNRGSGKTQFMLQVIDACSRSRKRVGYLTCEETIEQIAYTANRIDVDVPMSTFNTIDDVLSSMDNMDVLVLDSLSMINIGNKRRLRFEEEAIDRIYEKSKQTNCTIFVIMHMTKNGTMKGSSYIAHKVDTNLHIENFNSDDDLNLRKIYTSKNRFGASEEIYVEMTERGYAFDADEYVEVDDYDEETDDSPKSEFIHPPRNKSNKNRYKNKSFMVKVYESIKTGFKYIDDFLSKS